MNCDKCKNIVLNKELYPEFKTPMRINILLYIIFSAWAMSAQDFVADVKKMHKTIAAMQNVHIVMENAFYSSPAAEHVQMSRRIEIKRSPDFYYTKMGEVEMFVTSEYSLMVDNELKSMLFRRHQKSNKTDDLSSILNMPVDSLLNNMCDKMELKDTKQNLKHYKIYVKEGDYAQVDYWIDTSIWFLKKQVVYMRNPEQTGVHRVETKFTTFDTQYAFTREMFGIEKYLDLKSIKKPINKKNDYTLEVVDL